MTCDENYSCLGNSCYNATKDIKNLRREKFGGKILERLLIFPGIVLILS